MIYDYVTISGYLETAKLFIRRGSGAYSSIRGRLTGAGRCVRKEVP
jgi:hypothetical protein